MPTNWDVLQDQTISKNKKAIEAQNSPHGFPNRTDTVLSFDDGNRRLTITPTGASFYFWYKGRKVTKTGAQTCDLIPITGLYYIFYPSPTSLLVASASPWNLDEVVPVAIVYWDETAGTHHVFEDERHGCIMSPDTHGYLHNTVGARFQSGLTLSRVSSGGGGAIGDSQVALADGIIWDEDIRFPITDGSPQDISPIAQIPVMYREGSGSDNWKKDTAVSYPLKLVPPGGPEPDQASYNLDTAGTWSTPRIGSVGNFGAMWIFATNDVENPIIAIMGQRTDSSLNDAKTNNTYESLAFGTLPFAEMKLLYRIIFETVDPFSTPAPHTYIADIQDLRSVSNLPAGTYVATAHSSLTGITSPGAHPASAIGNIPLAPIAATNVQDAINELAAEKGVRSITLTVGFTADCDYVCTGTDDHVQINQALVAINAVVPYKGGTIILREGTYDIDGDINMSLANLNNVELRGNGRDNTILKTTSSVWQPIYINKNGITLRDLTIEVPAEVGSGIIISNDSVDDFSMINCRMKVGYAVNKWIGTGTANRHRIINNEFIGTIASTGDCIDFGSGTNNDAIILGNYVSLGATSDFINVPGTITCNDFVVSNNRVIANNGITLNANCNNWLIHGNDFKGSGNGTEIVDGSTTTKKRDNVAYDGSWLDAGASAIRPLTLTVGITGIHTDVDIYCPNGTDAAGTVNTAMGTLTGGGTLIFREGTYTFDTQILIPYAGITLEGQGRSTKFITPNTAVDLIYSNEKTGTKIRKILFDSTGRVAGTDKYCINIKGLIAGAGKGCLIEDCDFELTGTTISGIYIDYALDCKILGNRFSQDKSSANLLWSNHCERLIISKNVFVQLASGYAGTLRMRYGDDAIFEGNFVSGGGLGFESQTRGMVIGNTFEKGAGSKQYMLNCTAGTASPNGVISGNIINGDGGVIDGLIVTTSGINNVDNWVISNNTISGCTTSGMKIFSPNVRYAVVDGNSFADCAIGLLNQYGLKAQITNNSMQNCSSIGLNIATSTAIGTTVHGNDFTGCPAPGVGVGDIIDTGTDTRKRDNIAYDGTWLGGDGDFWDRVEGATPPTQVYYVDGIASPIPWSLSLGSATTAGGNGTYLFNQPARLAKEILDAGTFTFKNWSVFAVGPPPNNLDVKIELMKVPLVGGDILLKDTGVTPLNFTGAAENVVTNLDLSAVSEADRTLEIGEYLKIVVTVTNSNALSFAYGHPLSPGTRLDTEINFDLTAATSYVKPSTDDDEIRYTSELDLSSSPDETITHKGYVDDAIAAIVLDFTSAQKTGIVGANEVVDSFLLSLADGALWHYTVKRTDSGVHLRIGTIQAIWDKATPGTAPVIKDVSTDDIGDTSQLSMSVAINTTPDPEDPDEVELRASASAGTWTVTVKRLSL